MQLAIAVLMCTCIALASTPALAGSAPTEEALVEGPRLEAVVTRVVDGTTLDAQVGGVRTPIGYLGAETAPVNEPCGRAAFERSRELAGRAVLLESDPAYEIDDLSRRLYYVFTQDGASIDETLIAEGLARAVRTDAARGEQLAALESEARAEGRGCLWASPA